MQNATSFGASWWPLQAAVAVLKARAANRYGTAASVSEETSAAAVVAAEAWCTALGAGRLSDQWKFGDSVGLAFEQVLRRLSGLGVDASSNPPLDASPPAAHLQFAADMVARVEQWGLDPKVVLPEAAGLLAAGDTDPRVASIAAALESAASVH